MSLTGIIRFFFLKSSYGFILGDDGKDYFVHYANILGRPSTARLENERVTFDAQEKDKGLEAVNVKLDWLLEGTIHYWDGTRGIVKTDDGEEFTIPSAVNVVGGIPVGMPFEGCRVLFEKRADTNQAFNIQVRSPVKVNADGDLENALEGVVRFWYRTKGFGFIHSEGHEYHIPSSDFVVGGVPEGFEGATVKFSVAPGSDRVNAVYVIKTAPKSRKRMPPPPRDPYYEDPYAYTHDHRPPPRNPIMGTVRFWYYKKAYGFLSGDDGNEYMIPGLDCISGPLPEHVEGSRVQFVGRGGTDRVEWVRFLPSRGGGPSRREDPYATRAAPYTGGRGGAGYSGGVPIPAARGLGYGAAKPAGGKLPIRIGGRLLM